MTQIMTPSVQLIEMTDGQIDKAVAVYRDILRKHRSELGSETVQNVLGQPDYVAEQVAVLRRRVGAVSEMIFRHVKVDRTKTPQEMIAALGRKEYVDAKVLATIPTDGKDEDDVYFFPLKRQVIVGEMAAELAQRGLKADHYAQIQVSIDDPSFADEHPNGSQWGLDAKGHASFVSLDRWIGVVRDVDVRRGGSYWSFGWWGVGVRK